MDLGASRAPPGAGPRVERRFGHLDATGGRIRGFVDDPDSPLARWGDYWIYDDLVWPLTAGFAAIGPVRGWLPPIVERLDKVWARAELYEDDMHVRLPRPPSQYLRGRVFGCIFDDSQALRNRDESGMSKIMFEVDYPHADSTFPHTFETVRELLAGFDLDAEETHALLCGNAIECYSLGRFGLE